MKKFLSIIMVLLFACEATFAFPVDTEGWVCNPDHVQITASEMDLKSDLKNDFRVFHATLTNRTTNTLDIYLPSNKDANETVNKILNTGISFKELMGIPKQIAVDSYHEDVGTGKIAKAHKGLIYILASAGAVVAGAGLLGVYPQQKTEEYFSHRKIKKEYKKINGSLFSEMTLAPLAQRDFLLFVPIENSSCIIKSSEKREEADYDVYSDYHQL